MYPLHPITSSIFYAPLGHILGLWFYYLQFLMNEVFLRKNILPEKILLKTGRLQSETIGFLNKILSLSITINTKIWMIET